MLRMVLLLLLLLLESLLRDERWGAHHGGFGAQIMSRLQFAKPMGVWRRWWLQRGGHQGRGQRRYRRLFRRTRHCDGDLVVVVEESR